MPAPKYSEEVIEQAVMLREQGMTFPKIAAKTGMSQGSVYWHCLRLGADCPGNHNVQNPRITKTVMVRGNHIVRRFTPDEDVRITTMSLAGATVADISASLGRKHNSIIGRLMTLARNEARREAANSGGWEK